MMNKKLGLSFLLIISFIILSLLVFYEKTLYFDNFIYNIVTNKMSAIVLLLL